MPIHEAQELVRELIVETDHLSRQWHHANERARSARLEALRSTLQRLERHLGGDSPRFALPGEFDMVYQRVRDIAAGASGRGERAALDRLIHEAARLKAQSPRSALRALPAGRRAPFRATLSRWPARAWAGGALASLAIPIALTSLRRSPVAWGVVAGIAAGAVAFFAVPERSRAALVKRVVHSCRTAVKKHPVRALAAA